MTSLSQPGRRLSGRPLANVSCWITEMVAGEYTHATAPGYDVLTPPPDRVVIPTGRRMTFLRTRSGETTTDSS
jgi:hypothetical protein